jgi:tetratricopeptide (TPR) repeat protein
MTRPCPPKTLLVGWSGGDWRIISPLVDRGLMPHLADVIERGVCGNLASLWPDLPPLLWTSLATGMRPHRHGILGFAEPAADGGVEPITCRGRAATPLWCIAAQHGLRPLVVDFGPTFPADAIAGVVVSNRFVSSLPHVRRDPVVAAGPGLVHPATVTAGLLEACAAAETTASDAVSDFFSPAALSAAHPQAVAAIQASVAGAQASADIVAHLATTEAWNILAVRLAIIDQLAERFLMFHPPRPQSVHQAAFAIYSQVITASHRLLDRLLGVFLAHAGPEANVVVVSDRGLHLDRLRDPAGRGEERARAAPAGILAMAGPQVRRDERIYGANILDICPTLLHMLGLPPVADMDGRVLADAFTSPVRKAPVGPGTVPAGHAPPADRVAAPGPLPPGPEVHHQIARARELTRARCLIAAGCPAAAEPILQDLATSGPDECDVVIELVECLRLLGRPGEGLRLLDDLAAAGSPAGRHPAAFEVMRATMLVEDGLQDRAVERLSAALQTHGPRVDTFVAIARAEVARGRMVDAERACLAALEIDPMHRPALVILAGARYRLERYAEAAEAARTAIGLQYFDPRMHHLLGTSLAACGRADEAVAALEIAISQDPSRVQAHERLGTVHARQRRDFEAAEASWRAGRAVRAETGARVPAAATAPATVSSTTSATTDASVVVVTGLPRSGTSMMMQMLAAGGLQPLADEAREADDDNPRGYLEFDPVKRLASDASWIAAARGRAIKVIAPLLPSLPGGVVYRVILMNRDIREVLASQRAMLHRRGMPVTASDEQLARAYAGHLEAARRWCAAAGVPLVMVEHRECLTVPHEVVGRVVGFLGMPLDRDAMAAVVEAALWRQRGSSD